MENTKAEMISVEAAMAKAQETQQRELSELELAYVGGGSGDTIMY